MVLLLGRRIHSGGRGTVGSNCMTDKIAITLSCRRCQQLMLPLVAIVLHQECTTQSQIIAKQYQDCYAVSYLNLTDTPQFNSLQ
jgi:hypothetical protein